MLKSSTNKRDCVYTKVMWFWTVVFSCIHARLKTHVFPMQKKKKYLRSIYKEICIPDDRTRFAKFWIFIEFLMGFINFSKYMSFQGLEYCNRIVNRIKRKFNSSNLRCFIHRFLLILMDGAPNTDSVWSKLFRLQNVEANESCRMNLIQSWKYLIYYFHDLFGVL